MEILRDAVFTAFAPRNAALDDIGIVRRLLSLWYTHYKSYEFDIHCSCRGSVTGLKQTVQALLLCARSSPFDINRYASHADELEDFALNDIVVQLPSGQPLHFIVQLLRFPKSLVNKNAIFSTDLSPELHLANFLSYEKNHTARVNEYFREIRMILKDFPLSGVDKLRHTVPSEFVPDLDKLVEALCTQKYMIERSLTSGRSLTIMSEALSSGRHGPGAALGIPKRVACVAAKESSRSAITPSLHPYAVRDFPFARFVFTRQPENKISFVPKNYKSLRIISIEPPLMMFYQLGLGRGLRKILKHDFSTNLKDQQKNRLLARAGSGNQLVSTIDLSKASDSLAYRVVEFLLPESYFGLLRDCRATAIEGTEHRYEMFSAMGNGITFPLQSLIFITAVRSIVPSELWNLCSVYGDDIICPPAYAEQVLRFLSFLGFLPNVEKTFVDGPFRESCGGDYHRGLDVTMPRVRDSFAMRNNSYSYINNCILAYYRSGNSLYADVVAFLCSRLENRHYLPFPQPLILRNSVNDKSDEPSVSDRGIVIPFDFIDDNSVCAGWCSKLFSFTFKAYSETEFASKALSKNHELYQQVKLAAWLRDPGLFPFGVPPDTVAKGRRKTVIERSWLWPSHDEILAIARFTLA